MLQGLRTDPANLSRVKVVAKSRDGDAKRRVKALKTEQNTTKSQPNKLSDLKKIIYHFSKPQ